MAFIVTGSGCWQSRFVGVPQMPDIQAMPLMIGQTFVVGKAVIEHRDAFVSAELLDCAEVNREAVPVDLDGQPCWDSLVLCGESLDQIRMPRSLVEFVAGVQVAGSGFEFIPRFDADEVGDAMPRCQKIGEGMVALLIIQIPNGFKPGLLQIKWRYLFAKLAKVFRPASSCFVQDRYAFHLNQC
jgi:hypothetical protein